MFRKMLDEGMAGDNVGLLLRGLEKEDIERGMVLVKKGSITPHTKFEGEVYVLKKEEGWGGAVKEAIELSSKEYITYMDGDGSYNPEALHEMKSIIKDLDAVFCSRYKGGAKSPDDTFIRALGNNRVFSIF